MKKTIMEEVNELEKMANELQKKLLQDEADKKTLKKFYKYYQKGKIDRETYDEAKRIYRKTLIDRWF